MSAVRRVNGDNHVEVPAAEVHILDAGHFALDEQPDAIADLTRGFLGRLTRNDRLQRQQPVSACVLIINTLRTR